MGKRYEYLLEDARKLCNYILNYCDMQAGCETCKLWGIHIGNDKQCPIYIMSMLDEALESEGVELSE